MGRMTDRSAASGGVSVRFASHPHSVRTARQLVADTLHGWGLPALVEDARLVVTELCTNATLHSGAAFFNVSVSAASRDSVQVAVGDDGTVPAAAVVRRRARLRDPSAGPGSEATTGRGLAIVDELSSSWGVTVDGDRKWVWAHLPASAPPEQPRAVPSRPSAAVDVPPHGASLPPGWHAVRLLDCPVALGLAQDDHLDELVRELQLAAPAGEQPRLAAVIHGLLEGQAAARHMGRRSAQEAAAAGLEHVTVEMVLPERAAEEVQRLHAAVLAADDLCNSEELLTLASSEEVRQLRSWMHDEIRDQIRHLSVPRSFADWLAAAPAG